MAIRLVAGVEPATVFDAPEAAWEPTEMRDALRALDDAENALRAGYWIGGALSYEFGAQLAGAPCHPPRTPLMLLAAFRAPRTVARFHPRGRACLGAPLARISPTSYGRAIDGILAQIRDGEVYQINYTVPFDLGFEGRFDVLYARLARSARAPYAALLEWDAYGIASISPELFLRFDGERVVTKPMKGTALPGAPGELATEKNRAEHLMIVDLLRNDLHRISESVTVERLFEIETYPTFATMTSTIAAEATGAVALRDVLRAVYPCGSITGAPKRAAMGEIARREREPRGFYTGSVGFLSPERRGWWNVAIRTLTRMPETPGLRFDAGGGIVADSNALDEAREVGVKTAFLRAAGAGFRLIETLNATAAEATVAAHLDRMQRSAAAFGWPFARRRAERTFRRAAAAGGIVRLALAASGRLSWAVRPLEAAVLPVRLRLTTVRVHSADPLLAHKTSLRARYDAAAVEARLAGCDDGVIANERGEATETSRFNLFVREGAVLLTPPLSSGVLPGILRAQLVSEGTAREAALPIERLAAAQQLFIGNSARGLVPATLELT